MALIIGTRGSSLARVQANWVKDQLRRIDPGQEIRLEIIRTQGDATRAPLRSLGGTGAFTGELESALLARRVDLAVHSLKDLPMDGPEELGVVATPRREDARDVLVAPRYARLADLPPGARVGTGSLRRRAQVRALRPDLELCEVRGNLDTRLSQVDRGVLEALILAAAGLHRMGWRSRIASYLSPADMLPAPAQGALGLQMRRDHTARGLVQLLDHAPTHAEVRAERAFLQALGGGCHAPIGAWARVAGDQLDLLGVVVHPTGTPLFRHRMRGPAESAESLGADLAQVLRGRGAGRILAELTP